MSLSVVIVAYNSASTLKQCLEKLRFATDAEVVVVDNASSDESVEIANSYNVELLSLPENIGFGAAATIGAERASGESVCFLNPDCYVEPELFVLAAEAVQHSPNSCFVPDFRHSDGSIVRGCQPGYTRKKLVADMIETNGISRRLSGWLQRRAGYNASSWDWPLGTCFFVSRARFLELGGFDRRYFLYMEDVEFGWQMHQAGMKVSSLNHVVEHQAQSGSDVTLSHRHAMLNAARVQYGSIHYGRIFASFLHLLLVGKRIRRMIDWCRSG